MRKAALLGLIPTVFGCANPNSDSCASFIKSNAATASPFCATFTLSTVTATTGLPSWATACSSKPSHISKECSCYYTGSGSSPTTSTTPTTMVTSTTTTSAATGTASNGGSCGSAAIDQVVGYASGVTGGGSGSGTTVTSCSALESAIASGGVIKISGILSGCGIFDLKSDTTILGVGSNSGMTGGGLRIKDASNVILRNLKIYLAPESKDLISLDGATLVWIDHCDLSNDLDHDKDYYDGLLDITHASDYVTVSWTKFHDHFKGSLIGNSDNNGAEDTGHLRVTYHHNYFNKVNSRLPSIRFGTGHIYSSCYEDNPTSGVNSRMGAKVLVESNYFLNTPRAIITNLDSDEDGYAVEMNNIFVNSDIGITQSSALSPPYSYTTDPASCICDWVKAKAGVGIVG